MKNKGIGLFFIIYVFLYILNYLTPMGFGDDYLYSFVWQGKPEFIPLTADAVRVSSWHDLLVSQWSHYFTWSGRTVNHTLAQFFLWMGKGVFNFFNAFTGTLLVAEIYWCLNKGKVTLAFRMHELWFIVFALWAFTPGFVTVFLWLDGACNYLWPGVFLLGFMLPYIREYYSCSPEKGKGRLFNIIIFLGGILTGWTNENSICCIILALCVLLYKFSKYNGFECWMCCGVAGLLAGYTLLLFAPGNIIRLQSVHGLNGIDLIVAGNGFHAFLTGFMKVTIFQFWMWYFCLRTFMLKLKEIRFVDKEAIKDILLVKLFCCIAFGMSAVMFFSPEFPLRSGFPGTVQLIIATGILLRMQQDCGIGIFVPRVKNIMVYASAVYFVVTAFVATQNLYSLHTQTEELLAYVTRNRENLAALVLTVKPFRRATRLENLLSGFHIVENELLEDEKSWENVAFSRYYGIKGIRVSKEGLDNDE